MRIYTNVLLTVIAMLLGAIVAKLYFDLPSQYGPSFLIPRQGDFLALRDIKDPSVRDTAAGELVRKLPIHIVREGYVEVHGTVEVSGGTITVDSGNITVDGGEISITQ